MYIYLCIYTQRFRILCYHVTKRELTCSLTTSLLVGISFCFVTAIVNSASFFDCCFHSDCDVRIKTKSTKQRAKGLDMISLYQLWCLACVFKLFENVPTHLQSVTSQVSWTVKTSCQKEQYPWIGHNILVLLLLCIKCINITIQFSNNKESLFLSLINFG